MNGMEWRSSSPNLSHYIVSTIPCAISRALEIEMNAGKSALWELAEPFRGSTRSFFTWRNDRGRAFIVSKWPSNSLSGINYIVLQFISKYSIGNFILKGIGAMKSMGKNYF